MVEATKVSDQPDQQTQSKDDDETKASTQSSMKKDDTT